MNCNLVVMSKSQGLAKFCTSYAPNLLSSFKRSFERLYNISHVFSGLLFQQTPVGISNDLPNFPCFRPETTE